nr:hypothetical protein [Tanacetum cinerariifolium]
MRTRRSYLPITTNVTIPRRRQRKQTSNIAEPEIRTIVEMTDNPTMAQMLQASIEGYKDAIVVPPINANQDDLRAERLAKTRDPLALVENSKNPFNYSVFHPDQPSSNPTTAMNMTLVLMDKAFKLNYSTTTNNNQRISSNPRNWQIAQPDMNMSQDRQMQMQMVGGNGENQFRQYTRQNVENQNGYNTECQELGCSECCSESGRIQVQVKEFDLMAAAADL